MNKEKIISICLFTFIISCSGTLKESFEITDFTKKHELSLKVPEKYSVTTYIITIDGEFNGQLSVSASEEPYLYYTENDLPVRLNGDFYGGTAGIFIFPSNAEGKIEVTIEVPYNY